MENEEIIKLICRPSVEDLSKLDKGTLIELCLQGFDLAAGVIERIELDKLVHFPRSGNTRNRAMHLLNSTKDSLLK